MSHTIKKIEGWLRSNLHDVYSRKELESFLTSILDSLNEEEKQKEHLPEMFYRVVGEKFENLMGCAEESLNNFSSSDFDDAIELDFNTLSRTIDIEVDSKSIANRVWSEIEDYFNIKDFVQSIRNEIENQA